MTAIPKQPWPLRHERQWLLHLKESTTTQEKDICDPDHESLIKKIRTREDHMFLATLKAESHTNLHYANGWLLYFATFALHLHYICSLNSLWSKSPESLVSFVLFLVTGISLSASWACRHSPRAHRLPLPSKHPSKHHGNMWAACGNCVEIFIQCLKSIPGWFARFTAWQKYSQAVRGATCTTGFSWRAIAL